MSLGFNQHTLSLQLLDYSITLLQSELIWIFVFGNRLRVLERYISKSVLGGTEDLFGIHN